VTTVVDLFAGVGGFTHGAKEAGATCLTAVELAPAAAEYHHLNHPEVDAVEADLSSFRVDRLPAHDILLASPPCTGFTPARGADKAGHQAARKLSWACVKALKAHRPPAAIVENVPEFLRWSEFPAWETACVRLGYSVSGHLVDSARFGVPQNRVRAILVLTRTKARLRLKEPDLARVSADQALNWHKGRWISWKSKPLNQRVMDQIDYGRSRGWFRFLAPYYGSGSGRRARSPSLPVGTITSFDGWRLVYGEHSRMMTRSEYILVAGFPESYVLPNRKNDVVTMVGKAITPAVAKWACEGVMSA